MLLQQVNWGELVSRPHQIDVVKNTLLHKALESIEGDFSPLYDSLKGTTAVMFCNVANAPAKLIKDKSKDGIPELKAAYAEEKLLCWC